MEQALHLPEECGVILLPNCTLFPHGALPLHIFEPRYQEMLNDALESHCMFAIGCSKKDIEENLEESVSHIGTIGLIRASRETEDGTSNLILHGVMRIQFTEWLKEKSYPFAKIEPLVSPEIDKESEIHYQIRLQAAIRRLLPRFDSEVRDYVENIMVQADDPYILSDMISQQFIHEPNLRQKLLECIEMEQRTPLIEGHLKTLEN